MIPARFIRVWLGDNPIPQLFEKWWNEFKDIHPNYEFLTIKDRNEIVIPEKIRSIYENAQTYAGRSDILRLCALSQLGGIYVDTDMMPLKSFDPFLSHTQPFIGLRSKSSFANGVIGSPKEHYAIDRALDFLPIWYNLKKSHACSVSTGPAFISRIWFKKKWITHCPITYFYPYNGFGQPSRSVRDKMFSDKKNFPKQMFAAHYGSHTWGGKPK